MESHVPLWSIAASSSLPRDELILALDASGAPKGNRVLVTVASGDAPEEIVSDENGTVSLTVRESERPADLWNRALKYVQSQKTSALWDVLLVNPDSFVGVSFVDVQALSGHMRMYDTWMAEPVPPSAVGYRSYQETFEVDRLRPLSPVVMVAGESGVMLDGHYKHLSDAWTEFCHRVLVMGGCVLVSNEQLFGVIV